MLLPRIPPLRRIAALLGLAALALLVSLPLLEQYNVTWDEALGDFFFGDRYLSFFLSLDPGFLDFAADVERPPDAPDLSVAPFRDRPWEYYPVANILAAATSRAIDGHLPGADAFDGFHALNPLLETVLLVVLFGWMRRRFDVFAAVLACGLLSFTPRLFAHLFSNIKDVPEMVFFALALLAFEEAWTRGSRRGILAAGAIWGLALGTKANALFAPPIAAALVLLARTPMPPWKRLRRLGPALVGALAVGALTVFASWPYLWGDPAGRLRLQLDYIGLRLFETRPESIASPLRSLWATTPPIFLALVLVGLGVGLAACRQREGRWILPLAWIAVVFGRLYLPNAVNFDGVRHFLELFPALAIVAGAGGASLLSALRKRLPDAAARPAGIFALLVCLAPGIWATAASHPFQLAYWNGWIGGLPGARSRGVPQAGDYWGTSYRLGMAWLNRNAPPDTALAVPIVQHGVRLVQAERLRDDIDLLDLTRPAFPEVRPETFQILREVERTRPVYVMFVLRNDWNNSLMEDCRSRLRPIVRWELEGEPVLVIYRWTPASAPASSDAGEARGMG